MFYGKDYRSIFLQSITNRVSTTTKWNNPFPVVIILAFNYSTNLGLERKQSNTLPNATDNAVC